MNETMLTTLVWWAGIVHLLITSVNFFLPSKLRYAENLSKVSLIIRQIFIVHSIYIVIVLLGLAGLCLVFASDLAGGSNLGQRLSAFIALFWGIRVPVQLFYYDPAVKKQNLLVHILFTLAFSYLTIVFAIAAFGGNA